MTKGNYWVDYGEGWKSTTVTRIQKVFADYDPEAVLTDLHKGYQRRSRFAVYRYTANRSKPKEE